MGTTAPAEERRGRGRPAIGPRLETRLPEDVRDFYLEYAARLGVPVAELHRDVLVREADRLATEGYA